MPKFHVTALFAGVGGFELGLHTQGHRTSLFCECDPDAVSVLRRRFPKTVLHLDVRDTSALAEKIDSRSNLLTAGFPCTDLSQAGRTQGFGGAHSSLIRKVFELLDARPFENVLVENVPNWLVLHGGRYMAEVLEGFESRGYNWAYRTIDAQAFGVPQRRKRVFLFASQSRDPRTVLFHGDEVGNVREYGLKEASHGFYWTEGTKGLGWGENCVPTLKGGSAIGIPAPPAILLPSDLIITPSIEDTERLQGLTPGWTDIIERHAMVGGGPFKQRRRWHLIGNAVNVNVSTWLGDRLARQQAWHGENDRKLCEGERWPAAAWFDGRARFAVKLSTWPVSCDEIDLTTFLIDPGVPLSLRATQGFHKRIRASSLRFKPGFVQAVARHEARMHVPSFTCIAAE